MMERCGGGNGIEAPPREEESVTTRATARKWKAALWVVAVQGGGNTMTTWLVARRRSVGGEGGIMCAPKNYSTNSYIATTSTYLFPPFFRYLAHRPWCLLLW